MIDSGYEEMVDRGFNKRKSIESLEVLKELTDKRNHLCGKYCNHCKDFNCDDKTAKDLLSDISKYDALLHTFFNINYSSTLYRYVAGDGDIKNDELIANRQKYNEKIIDLLTIFVKKYPEIRFGQMLYMLGVVSVNKDMFNTESKTTYEMLIEKTI